MSKINRKKKASPLRVIMTVILSAMLLLMAVAGIIFGVAYHYVDKIEYADGNHVVVPPSDEYFDTDEPSGTAGPNVSDPSGQDNPSSPTTEPTHEVIDPDDVVWGSVDPIDGDDLINIMFVGQDKREGQGRQRSDSMILLSINPKTKRASLISFLRDTYVQIPGGYSDNRLNVAYRFGGFPLMKEAMMLNFGIEIDGCFECDFVAFEEIIDILGGVELTVSKRESDYLKSAFGIDVPAGTSTLDGEQTLMYARMRKLDGDRKRAERQRTILLTLFEKFKNAKVSELNDIANAILPKLTSDMSTLEIMTLLARMLPLVSLMQVESYDIPYEGSYKRANIRKMAVIVPDLPAIREKLENEYLPY